MDLVTKVPQLLLKRIHNCSSCHLWGERRDAQILLLFLYSVNKPFPNRYEKTVNEAKIQQTASVVPRQ